MRRMLLISLVLTALIGGSALAQSFSSLEERMTEAEFKAAGLDKLTPAELAALNAFVRAETSELASTLPAATPAVDQRGFLRSSTGPDGAIYSAINGEFRGWENGTRIKLANGQIWQVTDSTARLRVKVTDPQVTIEPGAFGAWFLKIDGYNSRAGVRRIK